MQTASAPVLYSSVFTSVNKSLSNPENKNISNPGFQPLSKESNIQVDIKGEETQRCMKKKFLLTARTFEKSFFPKPNKQKVWKGLNEKKIGKEVP